jgi:stringent starvation protein B
VVSQSPVVSSTRPYMVRAMYDWCVDNQLTPFIVVAVDASVRVPTEFVRDNEIVLNISMGATSSLVLGNDYIDFKARFGGVARDISVPMGRVSAIYARENGQGMTFPLETNAAKPDALAPAQPVAPAPVLSGVQTSTATKKPTQAQALEDTRADAKPAGSSPRPALTRIK